MQRGAGSRAPCSRGATRRPTRRAARGARRLACARLEGWGVACKGTGRLAFRRCFARAAWRGAAEVHRAEGAEAYGTPVSNDGVGVAFFWTERRDGFAAPPPYADKSRWARLERKF